MRREAASRQLLKQLQEPILTIFLLVGFYVLSQVLGMPVGEVLVMGLVIDRFVKTIGRVQSQLQEARVSEVAYHNVDTMITSAEAERERHVGTRKASFEQGCRFDDVSFSYDDKKVLDHSGEPAHRADRPLWRRQDDDYRSVDRTLSTGLR